MNRALLFLPLGVFAVFLVFFKSGLLLDQSAQPSQLIDRPVPDFDLVKLPDLPALVPEHTKGQVSLINIFGSWCAGCRVEHPLLVQINDSGEVPIYGINWADTPEQGAAWLARFGNSYTRVGNDEKGRNVLEFGVTGAPETFIVDADGRIRYRHVGPLTPDTWRKTIAPMVRELQAEAATDS